MQIGDNDYKKKEGIKMGEYVLEDFGKCKGYKITEQELFKIMDIVYPERDYGDGWHEEVHGNIWESQCRAAGQGALTDLADRGLHFGFFHSFVIPSLLKAPLGAYPILCGRGK